MKIQEAEDLYNSGVFAVIPGLLGECLEQYNNEDKQKAFRLIILAYFMNDDVEAAENTMLKLLKEFPHYELAPDETEDFQFVYHSFELRKSLDMGFFLGPQLTWGAIQEPWSSFNEEFTYSIDKPGIVAGGYMNIPISGSISFALLPSISSYSFKIHYKEPINKVLIINQKENHTTLDLPLYFQFSFLKKKVRPYINAGIKLGYLIASETRSNMDRLDPQTGEILYSTVNTRRNNLEFRERFFYYPGGSVGLKIYIRNTYLFGEMSYHQSFNNALKKDRNRFDQNNLWKEGWFDSDFRLTNVSFRVGLAIGIYRIKKIR